jgi:GTP-binding protein Era
MENTSKDFRCGYVTVAGRPNVGKSTLTNKLLNYPLSIVSPKPQTTRHRIMGILSGEQYQVIFQDTPGIMVPGYELQKQMVAGAWTAIEESDLVLLMVEAGRQETDPEMEIVGRISRQKKQAILAINKIDLIPKERLLPLIDSYSRSYSFREIIPISALKNDGLDLLSRAIIANLPRQPPFYPPEELTDRPQRFFVAEIIRQKVFSLYGEEIPYSTAVVIDEYVEREGAKDYVRAIVVCERQSQKGIIIGKRGEAIKRLGAAAREDVEALTGEGVFLELRVEVRKKWRQDGQQVRRLGQA